MGRPPCSYATKIFTKQKGVKNENGILVYVFGMYVYCTLVRHVHVSCLPASNPPPSSSSSPSSKSSRLPKTSPSSSPPSPPYPPPPPLAAAFFSSSPALKGETSEEKKGWAPFLFPPFHVCEFEAVYSSVRLKRTQGKYIFVSWFLRMCEF